MKMMNTSSLHIDNMKSDLPHHLKAEQMLANRFELSDMKCEAPIDLSRRCDSVETRKTPSPYNSSAFGGESSPSLSNRSNSSGSNFDGTLTHTNRSDTQNRYQSAAYIERNFSTASTTCQDSTKFPYEMDRSPSPDESMPLHHHSHHHHHRYNNHHGHPVMMNGNEDDVNRLLQAYALQKLQNIPATALAAASTPTEPCHTDALAYPLMLGRAGKLTRPFKAYSNAPLSIASAIPTHPDSLIHRISTERFNLYREEMLKKICEANGGPPTITNPKMRRTSPKNYSENEKMSSMDSGKEHQPQKQPHVASSHDQSQSVQAADSNGSDTNHSSNEPIKDSAYYERRRKNNAAAKKSRDRRRIKEDEIAIRAAFLERENLELKYELAAAKRQLATFLDK